ncbi:signal peptidase II [Chloroflexota bacterium]
MKEAHDGESRKMDSGLVRELSFLLTASLVIAIDQVSKFVVRANMFLGQSTPEEGFFRITYITNAGGSWGLFGNPVFLSTATIVVIVAIVVIYLRYPLAKRTLVRVALGLLLGGAIGNVVDRLSHGHVTDFIDVGAWPVFNLADCAIVIGIIVSVPCLIFSLKRENQITRLKDD